ncbi:helix-turn-helix transcriptional regulator [Fibrella aquatilis]|uniref:Helix-turn-helix transcriptional regulator n=1 Tax=Fibrella aquatilis TaxID=2817059 RepID=A0A939G7G6_9BACT|nr:helix-turn-helix transcriptional regulator [Fibrella aquatilis]MBO0933604.1 helix-turn-helix transcriptional regulator [Fibrella aquatilis]
MEIGKILIRLRLKTDLTQGEIADFVDVKQHTHHYWESDHTSIKHPFLPKLAEVYGVGIADLFSTNPAIGAGRQAGLGASVNAPLTPGYTLTTAMN